jgi:hypothetical protein
MLCSEFERRIERLVWVWEVDRTDNRVWGGAEFKPSAVVNFAPIRLVDWSYPSSMASVSVRNGVGTKSFSSMKPKGR